MSAKRLIRICLAVSMLALLSGCGQIAYYTQSVIGHSQLMLARQPLHRAISEAEIDGKQALAENLRAAAIMREFAVEQLALPDNGSYQNYVALDRDYPVWTVVAASEFSVDAHQWCYLVVGCASYRGYFDKARAEEFALELQKQGFETTVGGAIAYSTLGWFRDPLLPSMFRQGEAQLAETLFHELAHQVLYVKGVSDFNEAFATVVGERGAQMWLRQHRPEMLADYQRRAVAYHEFVRLLFEARDKLRKIYATDLGLDEMRARKESVFRQLESHYEQVKTDKWDGNAWFDGWFAVPMNNARLSAVATYYEQVPKLNDLLDRCDENFRRFYTVLKNNISTDALELPADC